MEFTIKENLLLVALTNFLQFWMFFLSATSSLTTSTYQLLGGISLAVILLFDLFFTANLFILFAKQFETIDYSHWFLTMYVVISLIARGFAVMLFMVVASNFIFVGYAAISVSALLFGIMLLVVISSRVIPVRQDLLKSIIWLQFLAVVTILPLAILRSWYYTLKAFAPLPYALVYFLIAHEWNLMSDGEVNDRPYDEDINNDITN